MYAVLCAACRGNFTENISGQELEMIYVKGGVFMMGATDEQGDEYGNNECPVHKVTLSDYYIGKYEVTQGLWEKVMGTTLKQQRAKEISKNRLAGVGDNYPMYYVTWSDAQDFCIKLSELTGKKYVLPTEAQWEYAARGGKQSKGYKYSGSNVLDEVGWYYENSQNSTQPVGKKTPNELGIYDMSGNVLEWCSDWYSKYTSDSQINPTGPADTSILVYDNGIGETIRIVRGGSWDCISAYSRVSLRDFNNPKISHNYLGFRVVCIP